MIMKTMTIGSVVLTGVLASVGGSVEADQINTSATLCQNFNAAQALDIDYLTNAVRNINAAPRPVICSVPRSPVPQPAPPPAPQVPADFFVDGNNAAGTVTNCTLTAYNFLGTVVAATAFVNPNVGNWSQFVSFANPPVGGFDYVSLLCTLPGGGGGLLYGVTAL